MRVDVGGDLLAQILLTDFRFTYHRLLFCNSTLAPEPVQNRQRHLERDWRVVIASGMRTPLSP